MSSAGIPHGQRASRKLFTSKVLTAGGTTSYCAISQKVMKGAAARMFIYWLSGILAAMDHDSLHAQLFGCMLAQTVFWKLCFAYPTGVCWACKASAQCVACAGINLYDVCRTWELCPAVFSAKKPFWFGEFIVKKWTVWNTIGSKIVSLCSVLNGIALFWGSSGPMSGLMTILLCNCSKRIWFSDHRTIDPWLYSAEFLSNSLSIASMFDKNCLSESGHLCLSWYSGKRDQNWFLNS